MAMKAMKLGLSAKHLSMKSKVDNADPQPSPASVLKRPASNLAPDGDTTGAGGGLITVNCPPSLVRWIKGEEDCVCF